MSNAFRASRDIIVRTENWAEALKFYGSVLGLPITHQGKTIIGFETGSFCRKHSPAAAGRLTRRAGRVNE